MAWMPDNLGAAADVLRRRRGLVLAIALAGAALAVVVPLPTVLMDVLLAGNLALAAVVLLTTILISSPLEFSLFPSVLLVATVLRLVLGIALSRLILTAGQAGQGIEQARLAAGSLVRAFGELSPSGSPAAGVVVFCVLTAVQFIVIIKGAGRISEVAARFALDAMPGRQMSIDSDYSAGLIDEEQARRRRARLDQEADFHGSMDGASKFLRGDAVACLVIAAVNLLGGLYVGVVERGWGWSQAGGVFTRLAVGAGLAMQVPGFLLATAAALLATRTAGESDLGEAVLRQLSRRPAALGVSAALLAGLLLTSLPKLPLLLMAGGLAGAAALLSRRQAAPETPPSPADPPPRHADLKRLLAVDPLRIDVGYALVPLVDPARKGDLLERIAALRAAVAEELGLVVPPVRIRDDMRLDAHGYAIQLRGAKVAEGQLHPNLLLAIGEAAGSELPGRPAREPVYNSPAVWIRPSQRPQAEAMGYAVVGPAGVLGTHLEEVVRRHAAELLTREQLATLLDSLRARAGQLLREVDSRLKPALVHKVLRNLLAERVPIRDLETILEALLDGAEHTDDAAQLTERARAALSRCLSQQYCAEDGRLWCVSLRPELEEALGRYVAQGQAAIPPEVHQKVARAVADGLMDLQKQGRHPVVLCAPGVRAAVSHLLAGRLPGAVVLGYNEINSVDVQPIAAIGTEP